MRRGRLLTGFTAAGAVLLITASSALAATPRQIYSDLAQHGKLTQHYSAADLQRAAQDATVEGYGPVDVQTYQPVVQHAAGVASAEKTQASTPRTSRVLGAATVPTQAAGTLPFTGAQLGVFVALGLALLAGGLLLRRAGRGETRA